MINFCGIAGVLSAFTGLVLIAIAGTLPNFVDVFLIQQESDIDNSEPIAGIGVFSSFYDANKVDDAVIAASGVPDIVINTDTLDFPLLFPSQENFVEEVLPVNAELAAALAAALNNSALEGIINGLVDPILELDQAEQGCAEYTEDLVDNVQTLFQTFQDQILFPGAIDAINAEFIVNFNAAIASIHVAIAGPPPANALLGVLVGGLNQVVAGLADEDGCELINADSPVDAVAAQCVGGGFAAAALLIAADKPLTAAAFTALQGLFDICATLDPAVTVTQCLGGAQLELVDTPLVAPAAFAGLIPFTACQLFAANDLCVDGTSLKLDYLQLLAGTLLESAAEDELLADAASAIGIYLALAAVGGIDVTQTAANTVLANPNADLPALFADDYEPCLFPQTFVVLLNLEDGFAGGAVDGTAPVCSFEDYFAAISETLIAIQNPLADTVALIATLYGGCAEAVEEFGGATALCPDIFTGVIVAGSLAGSIEAGPIEQLKADALQSCEDDLEDSDAVAAAQVSLVAGFVFYGLTVIASPFAFLVKSTAPFVYGLSAASALFAGVATLAALLIVRGAPVYEGVGGGINEDVDFDDPVQAENAPFVIFFTEGSVALIAFLDVILMFVTTGCFIGAAVLECLSKGDEYEDEEKEVEDEKVGSPAAAVHDDVKVIAANGEEVGI